MTLRIKLNRKTRPEIKLIGAEKTPVIIIDDVCENFKALVANAQSRQFKSVKSTFYPGIRAPFDNVDLTEVKTGLTPLLQQVYRISEGLTPTWKNNCFSLITVPEERLHPLQCLPHFDAPKPFHFAVLLYLSGKSHGGTGLFRHNDSGFETISEQRCDPYFSSANSCVALGDFTQGYIKGSNRHFELIYEVPHKANRLVIYPGNILHSTLVQPETDIDANPMTGRLTANLFIEFS